MTITREVNSKGTPHSLDGSTQGAYFYFFSSFLNSQWSGFQQKKQHKVRPNSINAPQKKQAFGAKSKARRVELVAGKDMVVEWKEKVPYCRVLAKVVQGGQEELKG